MVDTDEDGLYDAIDRDADNDSVADADEQDGDTDADGVPDRIDDDDDGDGLRTRLEGRGDIDGDGTPNHLDLDADGDGTLMSKKAPSTPTAMARRTGWTRTTRTDPAERSTGPPILCMNLWRLGPRSPQDAVQQDLQAFPSRYTGCWPPLPP